MITNSKLKNTTATPDSVLSGKTFYAGDKVLKTGNVGTKSAESVTLNASTTNYTFATSGKYCTGDMVVNTSTMAGSSVSFTPNGSSQSHTFTTSGKLCTGNMVASVSSSANWPLRMIRKGLYSTYEQTTTLDVVDGDGTYILYIAWCVKNSDNGYGGFGEIKFQGQKLLSESGSRSGFHGPFTFNITSSNKTLAYRWYWMGYQNFIYRRIA